MQIATRSRLDAKYRMKPAVQRRLQDIALDLRVRPCVVLEAIILAAEPGQIAAMLGKEASPAI